MAILNPIGCMWPGVSIVFRVSMVVRVSRASMVPSDVQDVCTGYPEYPAVARVSSGIQRFAQDIRVYRVSSGIQEVCPRYQGIQSSRWYPGSLPRASRVYRVPMGVCVCGGVWPTHSLNKDF